VTAAVPQENGLDPQQERQGIAMARVRPKVVRADHDMHHARPVDPRQLAAVLDAPQLRA